MDLHTATLALAALLSPFAGGAVQGDAAQREDERPLGTPVAVDLKPGVLPDGTPPAARERWERLVDATLPGEGTPPVVAFDLHFDVRAYPKPGQSNDLNDVRYRFMEPGYLRETFDSGRERLRGPSGDWQLEPKGGRAIRLQGRDAEIDKKELAERLEIARSFVALTDPSSLRIHSLDVLDGAPPLLPERLAKRASGLEWLWVVTPDLRGERGEKGPQALWRLSIGLDPQPAVSADRSRRALPSHLPAICVLERQRQPGRSMVFDPALLVELRAFHKVDGFHLPGELRAFQPADDGRGFAPGPVLDLWFRGKGSLRPALSENDFVPEKG